MIHVIYLQAVEPLQQVKHNYLLGHLSDTGDLLCGRRVSCVVRLALIFFSIFNIFENCYANFYHILLKAPLG